METTATMSPDQVAPSFIEKRSAGIRVWHWLFALSVICSLVTVLLASTTFRTRNNTALVQQQLSKNGIQADDNQARAVSHAFNDKIWDLHRVIGIVIVFLLVSRILIELFQPGEEKFGRRLKGALGFRTSNPSEQRQRSHYLQVKTSYLVFYALILVMALTGLVMIFEQVPFFKSIHGSAKSLHALVQYFIYAFIALHLAGVIRADWGKYPGLVSTMIHGNRMTRGKKEM
jgi:cytochrome b561